MSTTDTGLRYFWLKPDPEGADLAALRRGLGREAGSVPAMWRFYQTLRPDGRPSAHLHAEHAALTLFAMHQQSKDRSMHWPGVDLGSALFTLRRDERVNTDSVDRRFAAAATAGSLAELVGHLRGLINRLRDAAPDPDLARESVPGRGRGQGLDYSLLVADLVSWQSPGGAAKVRRRWGARYFTLANSTANVKEHS